MPVLPLGTRLVLVMHCREVKKPTATGPLALSILPNSELHLHGIPEQPLDLSGLFESGSPVLLLFPFEDSLPLDAWCAARHAAQVSSTGERENHDAVTLVVPDGNWRQASRAAKRIPGLERAQRVTLPRGPVSRWGMRRETKEGGLATFEAIARALGCLEGPDVRLALEELFDECIRLQRGVRDGSIAIDRPDAASTRFGAESARGARDSDVEKGRVR